MDLQMWVGVLGDFLIPSQRIASMVQILLRHEFTNFLNYWRDANKFGRFLLTQQRFSNKILEQREYNYFQDKLVLTSAFLQKAINL